MSLIIGISFVRNIKTSAMVIRARLLVMSTSSTSAINFSIVLSSK